MLKRRDSFEDALIDAMDPISLLSPLHLRKKCVVNIHKQQQQYQQQ